MVIIELIRELMFQQKKTIGSLADESGLSYKIIENIVLNDTTPTPKEAKIILGCMGVKLEEILILY